MRVAIAGGLEMGDSGAEALARAGAFVAKADSPTAINYNPAGFVKLRGHHVALSANILQSRYSFSRIDPATADDAIGDLQGTGRRYPQAGNLNAWFATPLHLMAPPISVGTSIGSPLPSAPTVRPPMDSDNIRRRLPQRIHFRGRAATVRLRLAFRSFVLDHVGTFGTRDRLA